MRIYELTPTDGRKSFYGKAVVQIEENGTETLLSYGTPIIKRFVSGKMVKLWDGWSATTGRHIKAFCGLDKAGYEKLELEKKPVYSMAADMTPAQSYKTMIIKRYAK